MHRRRTSDQINALPIVFHSFRLPSGRAVVLRSVYTGQDYSGRWGNHFSHALIYEPRLVDHWPIDCFGWPGWISGLRDGDDTDPPSALPIVAVRSAFGNVTPTFEETSAFLKRGDRADRFVDILRAMVGRLTDGSKVVIKAGAPRECVLWIACVQRAFPPKCLGDLSFSTFHGDLRSAPDVCATFGETEFRLDQSVASRPGLHVFDFVAGRHDDVPRGSADEYLVQIAEWMAYDPDEVQSFHGFCRLLDLSSTPRGDLHWVLRLFFVLNRKADRVPEKDWAETLTFADRAARRDESGKLLQMVADFDASFVTRCNAGRTCFQILLNGATLTRLSAHCALVWAAWARELVRFVQREVGATSTERRWFAEARVETCRVLEDRWRGLPEGFWEECHAQLPWSEIRAIGEDAFRFVLNETLDWVCWRNVPESTRIAILRRWIAVACEVPGEVGVRLRFIMHRFVDDPPEFVRVVGLAINLMERVTIRALRSEAQVQDDHRIIGETMAVLWLAGHQSSRGRYEVLAALVADPCYEEVLFGDWMFDVCNASDMVEAHLDYEEAMVRNKIRSPKSLRRRAFAVLLDEWLCEEDRIRLARQLVIDGLLRGLDRETTTRVLDLASTRVSVADHMGTSETLVQRIDAVLAEQGMKWRPRRLVLRDALKGNTHPADIGKRLRSVSQSLRPADYRDVLVWSFQGLNDVLDEGAYSKALYALAETKFLGVFASAYAEYLRSIPDDHVSRVGVAIRFWLGGDLVAPLDLLRVPVADALARQVAGFSRRPRNQLYRNVAALDRTGPTAARLAAFQKDVEKRRAGGTLPTLRWFSVH